MKIIFANHELILHPSGILLWPKHDMAIVSDLHLEKGSHFAKRGFFLPPYDSQETLERLLKTCESEKIKKLIILGDCFHDPKGYERLPPLARDYFDQLSKFDPIWIKGNHDGDFVPENMTAYEDYGVDGITFRHQAIKNTVNEISGHYHPKIALVYKQARIQRDCFISDGKNLIMPAFGSYTGGLSIDHPQIKDLLDKPFEVYALGEERIYNLSSTN